ncbi:hypothetical protein FIBSPDRAFT_893546 [Athelia psychrophila]|uniref:RRM domain-containing protein n=1 Tax=Athelia psychrophila TaxID=1759441 RepID=A0A166H172_9AGAM|nr:hypothetical protein FIBSPDRAFT_893546 [Fibularhizoctonia sp. CBS 109695]
MSTCSITVSGIARTTTEAQLHDFFTFCGKIIKIDFTPKATSAVIEFEKLSATKPALLLDGESLDGAKLSVTADEEEESDASDDENESDASDSDGRKDTETVVAPELEKTELEKTETEKVDKPKMSIAAYIATGYKLSDSVLQRAVDIDNKQGISKKFHDYYSKAAASPISGRMFSFYTTASKQILELHTEARRIADEAKQTSDAALAVEHKQQ